MKSNNEQNRIQKDWLDSIEKRLGYAWTPNKTASGEVLQRRHGLKEPTTRTRKTPTDSSVPMPPIHKPIVQTNLRRVSKYKPSYHHTF